MSKCKYYIINKPYNVLSQFTKELPQHITLQDFVTVEKDVYPVGRLDKDSEGLLLLTNDNHFKNRLLDPKYSSNKSYIVQVEGQITPTAINQLQNGVQIKLKKGLYHTKPCNARILNELQIDERTPPIRKRKNIPTSWLEITIKEGKNRQVRKMCASVGFPCLRLIRVEIKGLRFEDLKVGKYRALTKTEVSILSKST